MTLTYWQARDRVQRMLRKRSREVNRLVRTGWLKRPLRLTLKPGHPPMFMRPYGIIFVYEPLPPLSEEESKIILPHLKPFLFFWESGEVVMLGVERSIEDDLVEYDIKYGGGKSEITFSEALQIAQTFWSPDEAYRETLEIVQTFRFPDEADRSEGDLLHEAFGGLEVRQVEELQRPYGWVFVYNTQRYWETKDPKTADPVAPFSGACLVLRRGGIAVYLGTYAPFEQQLQEYERFLYGIG